MKRILFILVLILLACTYGYYRINPLTPTATIKGKKFAVELAVTGKEIEKGLSRRTSLLPGHGMLFIFNHKERYPFWMGGMQFPLDFIWMDGNQIVEITKNVPNLQDGIAPRITPTVPIDKVLELNAGEVDALGIVVGDTALFNK